MSAVDPIVRGHNTGVTSSMPTLSRHLSPIRGGASPKPLSRNDQLRELTEKAMAGDHSSLRSLLRAVCPAMLRVARKVVGTEGGLAEDVVQEALIGVVDALPRYRKTCTVTHFACRIAVLCGMNARRRESTWQRIKETHRDEIHSPSAAPAAREDAKVVALHEILGELPSSHAEIIALHYVAEYTSAEIAELVDAPLETVRTRLKAARKNLRRQLNSHLMLSEGDHGR